jgi:hypothetical protein
MSGFAHKPRRNPGYVPVRVNCLFRTLKLYQCYGALRWRGAQHNERIRERQYGPPSMVARENTTSHRYILAAETAP